jgi:hypothetical protein
MQNLTVCEVALGETDGQADFLVGAEVVEGKLTSAIPGVKTDAARTIRVPSRTLGTVFREHNLPPPDLIKMDIEGAEAFALPAAKDFILEHRPLLLVEVHGKNAQVEDALKQVNYSHCVCEPAFKDIHAHWYLHVLAWPSGVPFLDHFLPRVARAAGTN